MVNSYAVAAAGGGTSPTILRPNAIVGNPVSGDAWVVSGGANLSAVLSDDSDSSYAYAYSGDSGAETAGSGPCRIGFGTADFTGKTIASVTIRVRLRTLGGAPQLEVRQRFSGSNSGTDTHNAPGSSTTVSGAARTTKPTGGAWTQAAIDGLEVELNPLVAYDNAEILGVYEVYADVAWT